MLQWATDAGRPSTGPTGGPTGSNKGAAGTPARHFMGPIPHDWLGQWKRVEVPAAAVGLEGKKLRGMTFLQFGGSAKFAAAGAALPSFIEEREYFVAGKYPLHPAGDRTWAGTSRDCRPGSTGSSCGTSWATRTSRPATIRATRPSPTSRHSCCSTARGPTSS